VIRDAIYDLVARNRHEWVKTTGAEMNQPTGTQRDSAAAS
jgi:hypothetical protein